MSDNKVLVADRPTVWKRLAWKVFPWQPCEWPLEDDPVRAREFPDGIHSEVKITLDWRDRLRLLVSGRAEVVVRTRTSKEVGDTIAASRFNALPPEWMTR